MLNTKLFYEGDVTYALDENGERWYLHHSAPISSGELSTGETVYKTGYKFTRNKTYNGSLFATSIDEAWRLRHFG